MKSAFILMLMLICTTSPLALSQSQFSGEDGYRLWLNYRLIEDGQQRKTYQQQLANIDITADSPTKVIIKEELSRALPALLGTKVHYINNDKKPNSLIIKKANTTLAKHYKLTQALTKIGDEGFIIQTVDSAAGGKNILVTANTDIGLLYASFRFIQMIQTGTSIDRLTITESPKVKLRMLNHWDDLDRHVERGYAGQSIWDWHKLPDYKEQRYYDYARANASIGINGTVLNNVNANSLLLTPAYLKKVKALADIFRPYGIRVFLSIKFSSPQQIGGLSTSNPKNAEVQKWWQQKAKEIYTLIPDFGGFLVKANSEGQPGPGDYGLSHEVGANMLAKALAPYDGEVIWRAFVYSHEEKVERSLQAYNEFVPLDGKFAKNVAIQVKNGPIDFQPREPFSPMFGAMPKTPLSIEFQITQEYLGFSTHLVYLGTLFKEVLDTDTKVKAKNATVADVIDGSLYHKDKSIMAGVANIGSDRNWTGHIFAQANWYAFGRLAWDHQLSAKQIAQDWIKMTLTHDQQAVDTITKMMMNSHENLVNYMTPLGLHHIMGTDHHYGPAPWVDNLGRDDWNPVYYHQADNFGIGIDRTRTGSNGVSQYAKAWQDIFSDPAKTPETLLLWFHHLPWDYKMHSGDTLWNEIVKHYYQGVAATEQMAKEWLTLKDKISPNQFNQVRMALGIQVKEAQWWRDACVLYFQSLSKRPLPAGLTPPAHSLEYYQSLVFPYAPGQG